MWNASIKESDGIRGSCLLEIGCGTAPLLVAAAKNVKNMVGIDIAFRWLVVGKKRLAEAGLDIPLICACAEALPFPDQMFDRVIAESTIEHVKNQIQVVNESRRVLKPGGYFFLSTPNRFSVGPDPHVGILAGGYFPKQWLGAYVKRQGGIPPKRHLLSYITLSRLLSGGGFSKPLISLPQVSPAQREQFGNLIKIGVDIYHLALRIPIIRHLLYCIGPLFHAVAQRPFPESSRPATS
jgi:SAM-dependent methyltransferase